VFLSFILTAGFTLTITIAAFLFNQIPNEKGWDDPKDPQGSRIDQFVQKFIGKHVKQRELWIHSLERILLGLSDQQLLTGIAIVLAGLSRIPYSTGNITTYHLVLISDLVWLASNSHLLTLLVLRGYFQTHKWARALRASGMGLLACGLIIISVLTGDELIYDEFECPVQCLLENMSIGGVPGKWMIVNIVTVVYGYALALLPLFDGSRYWYYKGIACLEEFSESPTNPVLKAVAQLLRIIVVDFLLSRVVEILELTAWFVGGVIWAVNDRKAGQVLMRQPGEQDENVVGFAQFVALFLFVLPFFMVVETLSGDS